MQARFVQDSYSLLPCLRCGNIRCANREEMRKPATYSTYIIYKNKAGQIRFRCSACKVITKLEDIPNGEEK